MKKGILENQEMLNKIIQLYLKEKNTTKASQKRKKQKKTNKNSVLRGVGKDILGRKSESLLKLAIQEEFLLFCFKRKIDRNFQYLPD
jgi:hypothetical protein